MDDLEHLARAHGGLITRKQAHAIGVPPSRLERLARSGRIARIRRGIYLVAGTATLLDPWVVTRGHDVVLSFLSAAAWWGVDSARPLDRTYVTAPRDRRIRRDAIRGVRVRRAALADGDVTVVRGVATTTPLRTCLDLARHAALEDAVALIDGFFRLRLVQRDEFARAVARAAGPGRLRMQLVARLVDARSGSVLESLVRVLLWRNGMLPPEAQFAVEHRATGWRGYLDFAWPVLKVALECDGYEFHAAREPFQKDRRRWSTLSRLDWRTGVVTWFDVTRDPVYVVELVAELVGVEPPRSIRHTNVEPVTREAV